MLTIHPAFDVHTKTWFVDDSTVEAASLRELAALLRKRKIGRFKIIGYFPDGYWAPGGGIAPKDAPRMQTIPLPQTLKVTSVVNKPKSCRVYDHEAILNLWAEGRTGPEIARQLGIPRWTRVNQIVVVARERGDPRAYARAARR